MHTHTRTVTDAQVPTTTSKSGKNRWRSDIQERAWTHTRTHRYARTRAVMRTRTLITMHADTHKRTTKCAFKRKDAHAQCGRCAQHTSLIARHVSSILHSAGCVPRTTHHTSKQNTAHFAPQTLHLQCHARWMTHSSNCTTHLLYHNNLRMAHTSITTPTTTRTQYPPKT